MSGFVASATAIMSASERQLEIVSRNVANSSTSGYKRVRTFSDVLSASVSEMPAIRMRPDFAQGPLQSTGNPLDLAISGEAFFRLRQGDTFHLSRAGQFRRGEDGSVVNALGHVLQQAGGGDLVLGTSEVEILEDGTVLDEGRPVARIGLYSPPDGVALDAIAGAEFDGSAAGDAEEASGAIVRQGMIEGSNVQMADEMVAMMAAMRQAETGSRLVQIYDELMGRAVTSFAGGSR